MKSKIYSVMKNIIVILISLCLLIITNSFSSNKVFPYVKLVMTKNRSFFYSIFAIGTIRVKQKIDVSSSVPGIVQTIHFHSSQVVNKGDILLTLNSNDLKANLNREKSKYEFLLRQYQRYHRLFQTGAVSKSKMEEFQYEYQEAKEQLIYDQALVNKTIIRAPFSGRLDISNINQGQYLDAGEKIVSLENMNCLYVDFFIPENNIKKIKLGQRITFKIDEKETTGWSGKIIALGSQLNSLTRSLPVRAIIFKPYLYLLPGMYVHVSIQISQKQKEVIIPQRAIVYRPNGEFIFIYRQGKVFLKKIQTGLGFPDNVIIKSGLNAGDKVVVAGQQRLFSGETVNLVE